MDGVSMSAEMEGGDDREKSMVSNDTKRNCK